MKHGSTQLDRLRRSAIKGSARSKGPIADLQLACINPGIAKGFEHTLMFRGLIEQVKALPIGEGQDMLACLWRNALP